MELEN